MVSTHNEREGHSTEKVMRKDQNMFFSSIGNIFQQQHLSKEDKDLLEYLPLIYNCLFLNFKSPGICSYFSAMSYISIQSDKLFTEIIHL